VTKKGKDDYSKKKEKKKINKRINCGHITGGQLV